MLQALWLQRLGFSNEPGRSMMSVVGASGGLGDIGFLLPGLGLLGLGFPLGRGLSGGFGRHGRGEFGRGEFGLEGAPYIVVVGLWSTLRMEGSRDFRGTVAGASWTPGPSRIGGEGGGDGVARGESRLVGANDRELSWPTIFSVAVAGAA